MKRWSGKQICAVAIAMLGLWSSSTGARADDIIISTTGFNGQLNNNGQVGFEKLTSPTIGVPGNSGVYLWSGGSTQELDGTGLNGVSAIYLYGPSPILNNNGQFALVAALTNGTTDVVVAGSSGQTVVGQTGEDLNPTGTLSSSYQRVTSVGSSLAFNDNGTVAFTLYNGYEGLTSNLLIGSNQSNAAVVAYGGEDVPGYGGTPNTVPTIGPISGQALSSNGNIAFSAQAYGADTGSFDVAFNGTSSGISVKLAAGGTGNDAPIYNPYTVPYPTEEYLASAQLDNQASGLDVSLNPDQMNSSGQALYTVNIFQSLSGSTPIGSGQAIILSGPSGYSTEVITGESPSFTANGIGGTALSGTFTSLGSNAVVNNSGMIAFTGNFTGNSSINSLTNNGIFTTSGGAVTAIALKNEDLGDWEASAFEPLNHNGDVLENSIVPLGFQDPSLNYFTGFGAFQMNNNGIVVFNADLSNNTTGLYEGNGNDTVLVSNTAPFVSGSYSTQVINDLGQVVYSDGSGIHLFTPNLHWEANASGSWESGQWTLGLNPDNSSAYDVTIDSPYTVTASSAHTVHSITVGNPYPEIFQGTSTLIASHLTTTAATTVGSNGLLESNGNSSALTVGGGLAVQSGGTLEWAGYINGNVSNAGDFSTAHNITTTSTLVITGNYTQSASGDLSLTAGSSSDSLQISGSADLNGILTINLLNGTTLTYGTTYNLVNYGSHTGTFSSYVGTVQGNYVLNPTYGSNGLNFTVGNLGTGTTATPTVVTPGSSTLVTSGNSYAGLTSTNTSGDETTATLLDGVASVDKNVGFTFSSAGSYAATAHSAGLASDILNLSGTTGDLTVLQLNYSAAQIAALGIDPSTAYLAWLDPTTGTWVNAVDGNTDGGAGATFIDGAYNPLADDHLSYYGIDVVDDRVWAVIDHNSSFGVEVVPEPSTWALMLGGLGLLIYWRARARRVRSRQV